MRLCLTILALLLVPVLAQAKAAPAPVGPLYMDIDPTPLPIVRQGQIINYVFTTVRVDLDSKVDLSAVKLKTPYLRDALVRLAFRAPYTNASDYTKIDEGRLKTDMLAQANALLGPGKATGIEITAAVPKQRVGLPNPGQ